MKRPKKGPRPLPKKKARLPSRKGPEPQRAESFLRSFFVGLAVIAVVIVVKTALENTRTGRWIELTSYEFLQFRMASSQPRADLPVTVLDISGPNGLPGPTLETGIKQTGPSNDYTDGPRFKCSPWNIVEQLSKSGEKARCRLSRS